MSSRSARLARAGAAARGAAWALTAHALGAALLGALEALRLGSGALALVLVPVFAATGLLAGAVIAAAERIARGRPGWLAALVIAAPTVVVTAPIGATLFDGPYARTLPLAPAMPLLAPAAGWLVVAAAVWLGRRLASGDRTSRAIAIVAAAGAIGAIVRVERTVLGAGYPQVRIGAALAIAVLLGVLIRLALQARPSAYVAAVVAALALGTAAAAATDGLARAADRRLLADRGGHAADLVRLWRELLDLDRDGSSALLGGGDCDDADPARHPGALDAPGDGIDQDCDGADAVAAAPPAPPPAPPVDFRATPPVRALLERARALNVLVISVDALRADLLAPGAPHRDDFPRLARLLDESVRFGRAIAPAPASDVSLCTLVSGRLDPFGEIATTLPEAMRALGRRTASVVPYEVIRHVGEVLLDRGVDAPRRVRTDTVREDIGDHVSASTTTAEALQAIDAAGDHPWYTWAHYFDVHEHHQIAVPAELLGAVDPGGSDRVHRYRALLRAVDGAVGRLLDELAARGQLSRTIVWFLSDHGEALEDDPRLPPTHGRVVYAPLVRVPFAVRIPGVPSGDRTDLVSVVDVAPTVLALAGAPGAMAPLDGFDLVPAILDGPAALRPPASRALVIHEREQWGVVEWPYEVIVRSADDLIELYDLDRDPANRSDLAAQRPELARRLRARYAEAPAVRIDRTADGRAWRERQARRPPSRARP